MVRCTEPELWADVPNEDASDELIENYLDHLEVCPFHAEVERRRTGAVQVTFDAARSVTADGGLTFSTGEEAAVLDELARLESFRASGGQVRTLTLRANGKEIGSLDFAVGRKLEKEIDRRQSLQIYGRTGTDEPEMLLATYVSSVQENPVSYINYSVQINDQQWLRLKAEPSHGAKVRLTISCTSLVPDSQTRGLLAGFISYRRRITAGVTVLLLVGLGILVIPYMTEKKNGDDNSDHYVARNKQPTAAPEVTPPPQEQPSPAKPPTNATQTYQPPRQSPRPTPAMTPSRAGGGLRSGSQGVKGVVSLREVHKLFVDEQGDEFGRTLRGAVLKRLGELGFVTQVSRAESDARLRMKWEGDKGVTFSIISGDQELLNFTAEYAGRTPEAADALAVRLKERVQLRLR